MSLYLYDAMVLADIKTPIIPARPPPPPALGGAHHIILRPSKFKKTPDSSTGMASMVSSIPATLSSTVCGGLRPSSVPMSVCTCPGDIHANWIPGHSEAKVRHIMFIAAFEQRYDRAPPDVTPASLWFMSRLAMRDERKITLPSGCCMRPNRACVTSIGPSFGRGGVSPGAFTWLGRQLSGYLCLKGRWGASGDGEGGRGRGLTVLVWKDFKRLMRLQLAACSS